MNFSPICLSASRKIAIEESTRSVYLNKYGIDLYSMFNRGGGKFIIHKNNQESIFSEVLTKLPRYTIVDINGKKTYHTITSIDIAGDGDFYLSLVGTEGDDIIDAKVAILDYGSNIAVLMALSLSPVQTAT